MTPRILFALPPSIFDVIYAGEPYAALVGWTDVLGGPLERPAIRDFPRLGEVDILMTGWRSPALEQDLLARMPALKAVFHGAGSIRGIVTDAFWARDIPITSAYALNAIPVAEYTHGAILLSLKRFWHYVRPAADPGRMTHLAGMQGAYRSTVGLLSLGAIGRMVADRLRTSDLQVIAHDPYANPEQARALGIRLVGLEELFRAADVVSIHTPWLKETEGLVTGAHIASMKPGATLINTSRGIIIREAEMIDVLTHRPDLTAVLDITYPEPPVEGSPLYHMPNVVLTPHIAGSVGNECKRMGMGMVDELRRFASGEPLRWRITREQLSRMA